MGDAVVAHLQPVLHQERQGYADYLPTDGFATPDTISLIGAFVLVLGCTAIGVASFFGGEPMAAVAIVLTRRCEMKVSR